MTDPRRSARRRFPAHGFIGLAILLGAEASLLAGVAPVRTFFTPIAWTGYILLVDGIVLARVGRSQLTDAAGEFFLCALLSIPIWLIFEAYNLRLKNWAYVGLPEFLPLRLLGYGWSFATILPALFETSDLIAALLSRRREGPPETSAAAAETTPGTQVALMTFGGLCLGLPLLVPPIVGPYLFGLVWIGFVFLLAPVNASLGRWSPFRGRGTGDRARLAGLLLGGLLCGLLWEFWNYWAGAKWIYTFPMFQEMKLFEMPLPGFLGFPPFAVECYLMYDLAAAAWGGGWGGPVSRAREDR